MKNENAGTFLVLTDRDGTLIRDVPYLSNLEDVAFLPGVVETIRTLNNLGIPVAVITNQSGVARGFFTEAFVCETHSHMNELLSREGAFIDRFFYCPHLADAKEERYKKECLCRKPKPGLILSALECFGTHPSMAMMVGDSLRDAEAAQAAHVPGYLISNDTSVQNPLSLKTVYTEVRSFPDAVNRFLREHGLIPL
ncbi:MAG: D-glycero-alpha-D-manno-heptose-1,7-bisphosphate 7-phosphatase [Leptospirales bacterium]